MSCLFCKIASETIPATIIYQDNQVLAFDDVNPQAPQHKVIIPRKHIASLNELSATDSNLVGHMVQVGAKLAHQLKVADNGYRLVLNCNADGGQTVFHIHLHLLAGRRMTWPPG